MLILLPAFIVFSLICTFGYSNTFVQTARQSALTHDVSIQAATARVEAAKAKLESVKGYADIKPDKLEKEMGAMKETVREWWAKTDSSTGLKYSEILNTDCTAKYSSRYGGPMTSAANRLCSEFKSMSGQNDFMDKQTQIYNHKLYMGAMSEYRDAMQALSETTTRVREEGGSTISTFDAAMQTFAVFVSWFLWLIGISVTPTIQDMERVVVIGASASLETICVLFPSYIMPGKMKSKVEVPDFIGCASGLFAKKEAPVSMSEDRRVSVKDIPTDRKHPLSFHLGTCDQGVEIYPNILKFPHAIVAGTTGTGKTRLVYHMLCSIMTKTSPDKLKFVGVDMKRGRELAAFADSPFLAKPIAIDGKQAVALLAWLKNEMDRRYEMITPYPHIEDIDEYNKIKGVEKLPYLILLVDETGELFASKEACQSIFSDKETTVGKEAVAIVETLVRLARAAGIHCILCTQRPDRDSVPGQVKANCLARVVLSLPLQADSMTVLGRAGAELLQHRHCIFSHGLLTTTVRLCDISKEKLLRSTEKLKEQYGHAHFLQQPSSEFTTDVDDNPAPKKRTRRKESAVVNSDTTVEVCHDVCQKNIIPFRVPTAEYVTGEVVDVIPQNEYNVVFTSNAIPSVVESESITTSDVNSGEEVVKRQTGVVKKGDKVKQFDLVLQAYRNGFTTVSEIAIETGVNKGNVSRYLKRIKVDG